MKCPNCKIVELDDWGFDKYFCSKCKSIFIEIYHSELREIKQQKKGEVNG
ncbi:Zn finger protein [Lokiarchaeota virus WyrdV1]|nr:Zn finger protein [Lokiarchaeota virus WyrdV1]